MKTIIVATNFSASCLNAARYALALSKQVGVKEIVLYNSYELPISAELPLPIPTLRDISIEKLNNTKRELIDIGPGNIQINIVADENPILTGLSVLSKQYSDSIAVIGLSEKNKLETFVIGSNTNDIIKKAPLPVLVVPNKVRYQHVKKAVYACDLKKISETTPVDAIRKMVNQWGAKLLVLNVERDEANNLKPDMLTDIYKLHSLWGDNKPEYHSIEREDIVEGIIDFTEEYHADLLITVPQTYPFFDRIFHRSISKELAFNTHVPLLVIKNN